MGIDLVYGGGSIGLMGLIAQTVLDGGCSVLGYLLTCRPWRIMPLIQFSNTGCDLSHSHVLLFCLIHLQGDSKSTHAS